MAYAPVPMPRSARPGGYPISNSADSNPFAQFFGSSKGANALIGLGTGLLSGPTFAQGLAAGGQGYMQGAQQDDEYARMKAEEAARQKEITDAAALKDKYSKYFFDKGRPDIAQGIIDGIIDPGPAYLEDITPKDGNGGSYQGTSMEAQNWNILLKGSTDPNYINSPEYSAAYSQLTQPKMQLEQTADGLVPVYSQPQMPAWVKQPGGMSPASMPQPSPGGAPPMPTPAPMMGGTGAPPVATGNSGVNAGGVIPGTIPKTTESQVRTGMLSKSLSNEVPVVHANFQALADPKGQLLSMLGPLTNPWQSPEYQQAASATAASASKVLYALSGAAAGDAETEKIIREISPAFGDKPPVIADKLRRFDTYVATLAEESGDPQVKALAEQVLTSTRRGPVGPSSQSPGGGAGEYTVLGVE